MSLKTQTHARAHGFSLLELMLVLALVAALIALAAEGYGAAVQASSITTAADLISDAFNEARTNAVAQNTAVEVRVYDLAPTPGATPAYTALQLHWLRTTGATPPLSHLVLLPPSVIIDATAAHSPLIASNSQAATSDSGDSRLNSDTRVFHFFPDGSTDLNPATKWFLTVRAATQADPAHFPSDWACVSIDPTTGRSQIYRP
jgi:uncharacterized protein (TIGR02596 family)